MSSQRDKDFINKCLIALYQRREPQGNYLPAKEPLYEVEDGGVPLEMFDGEINNEGWVKWKILDSNLSESEIDRLENEYKIKFPTLFRAYLTTKFHLFDEVGNDECSIFLPPVPIDNPLGEIRRFIKGWNFLIKGGFIPFGYYGDGWGAICFDTRNLTDKDDFPVVWFDDELINENMETNLIESQRTLIFNSFEELMTEMFSNGK